MYLGTKTKHVEYQGVQDSPGKFESQVPGFQGENPSEFITKTPSCRATWQQVGRVTDRYKWRGHEVPYKMPPPPKKKGGSVGVISTLRSWSYWKKVHKNWIFGATVPVLKNFENVVFRGNVSKVKPLPAHESLKSSLLDEHELKWILHPSFGLYPNFNCSAILSPFSYRIKCPTKGIWTAAWQQTQHQCWRESLNPGRWMTGYYGLVIIILI